jgi:phage I-like protein
MSGAKATANIFLALQAAADGSAPEWINLLPAGTIETRDGRGPYTVPDMASLATQSLADAGGKLPIDENHSTDFAAPKGSPSPARGWIVELSARADGLWGRVQWNAGGKSLFAEQAYRGISPVFEHDKSNRVLRVLRASLTNTPNLRDLVALHAEGADAMEELLKKLRALLGLKEDAEPDAIYSAVSASISAAAAEKAKAASGAAAQAAIAKAAGLKEDADATTVLNAVTTLAANTGKDADQRVTALQNELTSVTTQLNALQSQTATDRATAFVDNAIKAGHVGVKPLRAHYIEQHAKDPARVEKEINAMPKVESTIVAPGGSAHIIGDADPVALAAQAQAYQKRMAEQGVTVDIVAATHAVVSQQQEKTK